MKVFLAVFERELVERRMLAAAALAFGLFAVAVPLIPGFAKGGLTAAEVRGGVAIGFALLLSTLTAVFLGGSILASDLLERRMGFYFSRPLSGWMLWAGKIAAALVLTFGTGFLVLLPAALAGGRFDAGGIWGMGQGWTADGSEALTLWGLGVLLLIFGTNALILIVRSRSPWAALDVAALVLVVLVVWDARNRLLVAGVGATPAREWWADPLNVFAWMGNILVLGSLAALLLAGAVQVVWGRTDVRRAHRSLSAVLWGVLIVLGIVFEILTLWWVRVSPRDLMGVTQVVAAPAGSSSWIAFEGPAAHRPGYSPTFLYDVESGRAIRTRMGPLAAWWSLPVRISNDGSRAVWLEFQGLPFRSPVNLDRLDLRRPGAEPEPTRISLPGGPEGLALSPDGRRIAIASRHRLTVEDVETGRLLASAGYGGELWFSRLAFVGPDRVRLYQISSPMKSGSRSLDIFEIDVATSKVLETGRLSDLHGFSGWLPSPDGERALLRTRTQLQLRDARTGELLADFGAPGRFASFLDDGRVTVVTPERDLIVLDRDGSRELRRFHLEGAKALIPVDQPAPGSLRVVTSRTADPGSPWTLHLLDLQTGAVRSLGDRRLALLGAPKRAGSRLSLEGAQGVIWKEPYSLRERVVLKD
ncbi:MAG TPA: hypothetical protein VHC97_25795 [Thermoanaerobaculia bacterium]|jgi:hypothetical protein|nr:hypothetical protein [Thermoanaerobaculia bacterium]